MPTVRDAVFTVMRECGLTRIFANPGSTEIPFLADLPDDLDFVLGLHEGSVVGMATGFALARERPAFVNLHTTAGLGNAVGALATARVNRAPLVVVVGQQDRRHLALQPFLAGQLRDLAGSYPVWVAEPALAQDVPAAIRRAFHEATLRRGPAIVIVAMDDWSAPVQDDLGLAAPREVAYAADDPAPVLDRLAAMVEGSASPVLVVGADADSQPAWDALVALAERLGAPVWQEAFGARAGFPQDHRLFAGHLPADRPRLREALAGHDLALVVGAGAFRQYPFIPGPLRPDGLAVAVIARDPDEVHHSDADLAVLGDPAAVCAALASRTDPRPASAQRPAAEQAAAAEPATAPPHRAVARPEPAGLLHAADVFIALAERLPADVVLVEETPSSRPDLEKILPARAPRGFVSAAMGGLGFGLPAAAGLRMGDPTRPVVAILGDGSSLYAIQGLWSAAQYGCGVLYIVLRNGRYAVMDRLADRRQGKVPWPAFDDVDICGLAASFGCAAQRVSDNGGLRMILDEVIPTLRTRTAPLLLDVEVAVDEHFNP